MTGTGSSIALARICLVFAALLWSLGSVFMRLLREPLGLGLDSPNLSPLQIAFFRGLFGGLIMLALVPRTEIRFRPAMMAMVIAFSVMSVLYLSALGLGAAANAIFLQEHGASLGLPARRAIPGGTGGLARDSDCRVGHVRSSGDRGGRMAAQAAAGGQAPGGIRAPHGPRQRIRLRRGRALPAHAS